MLGPCFGRIRQTPCYIYIYIYKTLGLMCVPQYRIIREGFFSRFILGEREFRV
jgi:hypothetical protein